MYWTLDRKQLPDSVRDPPSGPLCISGTVVDSGVFAPVLTFQKLFEDEGVPVTDEEVRGPMGVHKRVRRSYFYGRRAHRSQCPQTARHHDHHDANPYTVPAGAAMVLKM